MDKAQWPAPAVGQIWNWNDCSDWRSTTLMYRDEDGWTGRSSEGALGYFPDAKWEIEMSYVGPGARDSTQSPARAAEPEPKRPTKVAAGQRWHVPHGDTYQILAVDGGWSVAWEGDRGGAGFVAFGSERVILRDEYLGMAAVTAAKHEVSQDGKTWVLVDFDPGADFVPWHRLNGVIDRQPRPSEVSRREAQPRRQVSTNGRDFVDYERLVDPDPFDSYKWRNVLTADGNVTHWYPNAGAVEREQRFGLHLHMEHEIAFKMRCREGNAMASTHLEAMLASEKAEPEREPSRGCAPMLFGGIVRLR